MVRALKLPNQVPRPPADDWYVSVRLGVNEEDLHSATGPVDRPHGYRFIGKAGRFEDAFVNVESIAKGKIQGRIANVMSVVQNRNQGDVVEIPESQIQDWLILRSDGTEEGNIIGKTLEKKYSPSR